MAGFLGGMLKGGAQGVGNAATQAGGGLAKMGGGIRDVFSGGANNPMGASMGGMPMGMSSPMEQASQSAGYMGGPASSGIGNIDDPFAAWREIGQGWDQVEAGMGQMPRGYRGQPPPQEQSQYRGYAGPQMSAPNAGLAGLSQLANSYRG